MNQKNRAVVAWVTALVIVTALWLPALAAPAFSPPTELERRRQALYSFLDAAFSVEYGDRGRDYLLRWQQPVRVSLTGEYLPEDEAFLDAFLAELTQKAKDYGMPAFPGITRVKDSERPNIRVIYCPLDEMPQHLNYYEPGNWGYFEYYYDNYRMTEATVVVATDVTTQAQRNHLLMEEIVGALGLTNDIYTYSDSIVYQPWTETQQLSDLDWLMLSYLYSDHVKPGMTSAQAYELLLPVVRGL